MKLVDLNLLIYAVDSSSPRHDRARPWLEAVLSGSDTVALPWVVLLGFLAAEYPLGCLRLAPHRE